MAYAEETKVPLEQSIAEIIGMLRKAGAVRIAQYEEPDRFTVTFEMDDRLIRFRVPLVTEYAGPASHGNGRPVDRHKWIDQRNRQKGRALMLVIKAKLESVVSEVETLEEAFLANVVMSDGATLYERVRTPIAVEYQTGKAMPLLPDFRGGHE